MKRCVLVVLIALVGVGCASTHTVYKIPKDGTLSASAADGIPYALPRTGFELTFEVTKTTLEVHPIAKAENDIDALKNAAYKVGVFEDEKIMSKGSSKAPTYSITKQELSLYSEADPDEVYVVDLESSPFKSQEATITLNKLGVITAGVSSVTDKRFDIAVKFTESVATLLGKVVGVSGEAVTEKQSTGYPKPSDIADRILDIRKKRTNLIGGGADGLPLDTFKAMLDELNKAEATLLQVFIGVKSTSTWTGVYRIVPDRKDLKGKSELEKKLFAFSATDGVKNLAGPSEGLTSKLSDKFNGDDRKITEEVKLKIHYDTSRQIASVIAKAEALKKTSKRSFYYRIPIQCAADIVVGDEVKKRELVSVAQFGEVVSLPTHLLGGNAKHDVAFDEATGAVTKIGSTSEAVSPDTVGSGFAALASIGEAIAYESEPEDKLQKEIDRLKKLKELKDAFNALFPGQDIPMPTTP